jgi:hypothetical protein
MGNVQKHNIYTRLRMNHAGLSASSLVYFRSQPAMPQRERCQWNVVCGMGQRKDKCWMCSEDRHCHMVTVINEDQFSSPLLSSYLLLYIFLISSPLFSFLLIFSPFLVSSHILSALFFLLLSSLLCSFIFFPLFSCHIFQSSCLCHSLLCWDTSLL